MLRIISFFDKQNSFETKNVQYFNEYYELHLSVGRFDPSPLCFFGVVFSGIFLGGTFLVNIISKLTKKIDSAINID